MASAKPGDFRLPDPYRTIRAPALPATLPGFPEPPSAVPRLAPRLALEYGLTCAALGDDVSAIAALRQAVAQKPALPAAWRGLAELLSSTGDAEGAAHARAEAARHAAAPPAPRKPLLRGKLEAADAVLREKLARVPHAPVRLLHDHLKAAPTDVAALRMLAEIHFGRQQNAEAERLLERALDIAPDYSRARQNYAFILMNRQKAREALPHVERLLAEERFNPAYRTLMASALSLLGEYERAIVFYAGVARDAPQDAAFWLTYGHALKYAGRRDESVRAYRTCLSLSPSCGEGYWSLANMKNERFTQADLDAMQAHLAGRAISQDDRVHLHYALGRAQEQDRDFAGSFANYAAGAKLRSTELGWDASAWSCDLARARAVFTADFYAAHEGQGCPDPAPIFILGLPRTGSTLVEQILASHSTVEGTMELPEISRLVRDLAGPDDVFPECLLTMSAPDIARLGALYIERTRIYRKTDRPIFIDKMPPNWAYAGFIRLILPNARIIDTRRNPMASCFSAFKQLFGGGAGYSYDLGDLGRYYRDYLATMAHMDEVAPGAIHRVVYEDMVADTDGEIRRLLAACGLAFEEACLRFYESRRAVGTPSSEQVRQPIFRDALDQWRSYEPWLEPLRVALAEKGGRP